MQRERVSFLLIGLAKVEFELVVVGVGPDPDRAVGRARCENLLLDADVETQDALAVETGDKVLVLVSFVRALQLYIYFQNLVGIGRENESVKFWVEGDLRDLVVHDIADELPVVDVLVTVLKAQVVTLSPLVRCLLLWSVEEDTELPAVSCNHEPMLVALLTGGRFRLAHLKSKHRINTETRLVRSGYHDVLKIAI